MRDGASVVPLIDVVATTQTGKIARASRAWVKPAKNISGIDQVEQRVPFLQWNQMAA
jgi:hypothetical protein